MKKHVETYGVKEIRWSFNKAELESILRTYLFDKGEVKTSAHDYSLKFDWFYGEDDDIEGVCVTKSFKEEQSQKSEAPKESESKHSLEGEEMKAE